MPLAKPARLRRHHWGVLLVMMLLVVVPIAGTAVYLFAIAKDQYASTTAFTVRQDEGGSATDLLGGLDFFGGGGTSSDRKSVV